MRPIKQTSSKVYNIVYIKDEERCSIDCSIYSLNNYIKQFENKGYEIVDLVPHEIQKTKTRRTTIKDRNKVAKQKYYMAKYTMFYRKYKSNKIDETLFDTIINVLKEFKEECRTKTEFEKKFEKYKKTLDIK